MTCISFTEDDIICLTSVLFGRPLVERACSRDRPFLGLSEVAVLGSSRLSDEVWSTEDYSDLTRRSYLMLVIVCLGAPVVDIVLKVSFSDEFFNIILERDALFRGVADISMIPVLLALVPFQMVSLHRIRSFVYARVLRGQEYILMRPCQIGEVIVLTWRESWDPLLRALGLLLVGIQRSSVISSLTFLVVPVLFGRHKLSCWCNLMRCFYWS